MSNHSHTTKQTEQYLQLWIYFLPVVGVIPAVWTLSQSKPEKIADSQQNPLKNSAQLVQQLKASRLSLNLTLIWLCAYVLFSYGAADETQIIAFRFLYANAIVTTSYFVACTYFITRLGKKRLFSAAQID
ncbi:hypothetical protein C7B62_06880 [Pleurocapsa sp. CCALA 161]|uniref:hypothetical protein n=1 Tax=Pleurocapsa sp. CCALA 161 TaxID=2107688 RepID=UPI000D0736D2|nr:hypothetical protein [Pleurocapsa sp. CCALA 161]PSB11146.1 hypothetical protein C7B62_06880 [Pleurocapsa sp. CCALA 161]